MTARFVLSPKAQDDLDGIWDHSLGRWGAAQAADYLRQIRDHVADIAARPMLGRARDDIRPGYRQFRSGSHMLFYRIAAEGIDIIRILHVRMDVERQLDDW